MRTYYQITPDLMARVMEILLSVQGDPRVSDMAGLAARSKNALDELGAIRSMTVVGSK